MQNSVRNQMQGNLLQSAEFGEYLLKKQLADEQHARHMVRWVQVFGCRCRITWATRM